MTSRVVIPFAILSLAAAATLVHAGGSKASYAADAVASRLNSLIIRHISNLRYLSLIYCAIFAQSTDVSFITSDPNRGPRFDLLAATEMLAKQVFDSVVTDSPAKERWGYFRGYLALLVPRTIRGALDSVSLTQRRV